MQFQDILKSAESEGKEKHVPVIEIGKGKGEGGMTLSTSVCSQQRVW